MKRRIDALTKGDLFMLSGHLFTYDGQVEGSGNMHRADGVPPDPTSIEVAGFVEVEPGTTLQCCERCGEPRPCQELRARWFCDACTGVVDAWIEGTRALIEGHLRARGMW